MSLSLSIVHCVSSFIVCNSVPTKSFISLIPQTAINDPLPIIAGLKYLLLSLRSSTQINERLFDSQNTGRIKSFNSQNPLKIIWGRICHAAYSELKGSE
jgi:hypothetical protein